MEGFTPVSGLVGGALIGLAASLLLYLNGRVAGISGILGGLLPPAVIDTHWRIAFLAGLPIGAFLWSWFAGRPPFQVPVDTTLLVVGGVITGLGVQVGRGCTSGHGVCGLSRLSARSAVATVTFMLATFATVYVVRHVLGGAT